MGLGSTTAPLRSELLSALPERPFTVDFWDGSTVPSTNGGGPLFHIRSPRAVAHALLAPGQLGLSRAYVSGELEVDDIDEVLPILREWQPPAIDAAARRRLLFGAWPRRRDAEIGPGRPALLGRVRDGIMKRRSHCGRGRRPAAPEGTPPMAIEERRGPRPLAEILGELFAARGYGRLRGPASWRRPGTRRSASRPCRQTRVGEVRRGVLNVTVAHSTLLEELAAFRKPALLAALRRDAPGTVDPRHPVPRRPDRPAGPGGRPAGRRGARRRKSRPGPDDPVPDAGPREAARDGSAPAEPRPLRISATTEVNPAMAPSKTDGRDRDARDRWTATRSMPTAMATARRRPTPRPTSGSSKGSRRSGCAPACTSATRPRAACTTWSTRSSTTRSTRRWPATAGTSR